MIHIGIDPGTNTGIAVSKNGQLTKIETLGIIAAMNLVRDLYLDNSGDVFVRIEDARKRVWFGRSGREKLQGAGSIKRDCSIWEEFLTYWNIRHEFVAPMAIRTKLSDTAFQQITGWEKRTSNHSRDAAMLIFMLK